MAELYRVTWRTNGGRERTHPMPRAWAEALVRKLVALDYKAEIEESRL